MDVREKLVELLDNSFEKQYGKRGLLTAHHTAEDLIANGVIVLPCKVGDKVWFNTYKRGEPTGVKPHKISSYRLRMVVENEYASPETALPDFEFGRTVFLTREEAEAALRKEGQ